MKERKFRKSHKLLKTIYIPIEIKSRELESQALLAGFLIEKGYRVYIGSHAAIFSLLEAKKYKAGIYLDKGTQTLSRTRQISSKCDAMYILDQELGPVHEPDDSNTSNNPVAERFYQGTEDYVHSYLTVGPYITREAKRFLPPTVAIVETGWPRIDLQTHFQKELYQRQSQLLQQKYGQYFLLVTDFGPLLDNKRERNRLTARIKFESPRTSSYWNSAIYDREQIVKILKEWGKSSAGPKIVFRPHPSEDSRIWKRLLKGIPNIFIVKGGEITSFISASQGVIHRGSTVAVQAFVMGKPLFLLEGASTSNPERKVAKTISKMVVDENTMPEVAHKDNNHSSFIAPPTISHLLLMDKTPATIRVVDAIEQCLVTQESSTNLTQILHGMFSFRKFRRVGGLIRDELMYLLIRDAKMPQSVHLGGGIRKRQMRPSLGIGNNGREISIKLKSINLWEIS